MIQSILLSLFCVFTASLSGELRAVYVPDEKAIVIEGLAEDNPVSVYFGAYEDRNQPRVLGSLQRDGDQVTFKAKYGFSAGSTYTVVIGTAGDKLPQKIPVTIPAINSAATTRVVNVFPSSSHLPMNQLKLYIEFSAPMRMGRAYDHIKLYHLPDRVLEEDAFLTMPEELWDPERKRLTIFFDPGRIKRGVQPNLQLGLPLVEGRRYELQIDKQWLDINGAQLEEGFKKTFDVVAVDRALPEPENWQLSAPLPGTDQALVLDFGESMDYGLLHSTLLVIGENDTPVEGAISLSDQESKWHFVPAKPWQSGNYRIVINSWLEDLAGNNLRRKFDVDLEAPEDRPKDIREVIIPFKVSTQNQDKP